MATKYNQKLPSQYPGKFGKRENRLTIANFSVVSIANESYTMATDDGISHVTLSADTSATTLILPEEGANIGRIVKVYVSDSTSTAAIKESNGTTDALAADNAAGVYELFCTGSDWIQVG